MFEEKLYRTGQLEDWFRQDRKTILKRVDLYASHFSDSATREDGNKQRGFTRRDVQVYATIKRLEAEGEDWEGIEFYLSGNQPLDPLPEPAAEINAPLTAMVLRQQALSLEGQRDAALAQVRHMEQDLAALRDQMRQTTLEMAKLMAQREGELREEIGRLKARLEALENKSPSS